MFTKQLLLLVLCVAIRLCGALSTGDVPPNIVVIGGSSGMGKAAAVAAIKRGGKALIVSRSEEKLVRAAEEIKSHIPISARGSSVKTAVLDATDEAAVEKFASELDDSSWDGLVVSAAGRAPHGAVTLLPTEATRDLFETKFWSAYHCAKHIAPRLREGGAIAFVAGVLNRRPGLNCAPLASTNGALEGLTRALALEMGPRLRVNCLSPGFCDTERFDHMEPEKKKAMLANTADSLPLKRTGRPEDMGEAIYYLLTAKFCTGVILDVDGGHSIRQYANPTSDPMRQKD
mmetsp:Transcript_9645/g.19559  ORF Transcript_9645/g.19559 Transcript_9645/m.19559 type:complete len:288 (-) Transcript_9645:50-913(-)